MGDAVGVSVEVDAVGENVSSTSVGFVVVGFAVGLGVGDMVGSELVGVSVGLGVGTAVGAVVTRGPVQLKTIDMLSNRAWFPVVTPFNCPARKSRTVNATPPAASRPVRVPVHVVQLGAEHATQAVFENDICCVQSAAESCPASLTLFQTRPDTVTSVAPTGESTCCRTHSVVPAAAVIPATIVGSS